MDLRKAKAMAMAKANAKTEALDVNFDEKEGDGSNLCGMNLN